MINNTIPSLRLTPKKSTLLLSFILVTHMSALGVVLLLSLELWMQLAVLFVVMMSLIQAVRTHVLRSNGFAIKSAEWDGEGEWTLFTSTGDELAARLKASSYVQPWCVILNFSISRFGRRSLILLPDAVDPELLRRLRVRLRLLGWKDVP